MTRSPATGFARRHRTSLLLGLAVLVLLLGVTWAQRDSATYDGALDPRSPQPAGAQAVARVLADHGVDVRIARGQRAFLSDAVDTRTAVVVTNAGDLGRSTLAQLRKHASRSRTVVLVGASTTVLEGFDLQVGRPVSGLVDSGCRTPVLRGLVARFDQADTMSGPGCFSARGGVVVARPETGFWVVSTPQLFRNDTVLRGDNAAVALRLLGQRPHVLWYVADPADTVAADAVSIRTFLPHWLLPALWLTGVAVVAFVLWRARRLGPLVPEPLPVVVRAAESTESRGRLYRRTRDRDHAARILRAATRRRLADRLALPDDEPATLAVAVPEHRDALLDSPVADDAALAELGRDLTRLEDHLP